MRNLGTLSLVLWLAAAPCVAAGPVRATKTSTRAAVTAVVAPLMAKHHIPGMAVGVIAHGREYVSNYGVASLATRRPVDARTLFEIGSISKTFTATLAALAQVNGHVALEAAVDRYLPALAGSAFGKTTLLQLATHTAGGLPLYVPDAVHNPVELVDWLRAWQPACPPGTCRASTNIGIGTLGLAVATDAGQPFASLMRREVLDPLGLRDTWYRVPDTERPNYAQGYTRDGTPIRMAPGVLDAEAYGVRTTAHDLLRFVAANLRSDSGDTPLGRAIMATHVGYFRAGALQQDLIWEQYAWPVTLPTLLAGNAPRMLFDRVPATRLEPPAKPSTAAWINKTGSTNGFAAYVAFIPGQRLGIVLLANRSYPIAERVTAAYRILAALTPPAPASAPPR